MTTTSLPELYRRALDQFGATVHRVGDGQWNLPTPCSEWDVRALVNHVVGENRWAPLLFDGRTVDEVGARLDGDLLGEDPRSAWTDSATAAADAVARPGALDRVVHLSFGDTPGSEYTWQLLADTLIHGWDLARAVGADDRLDPELVEACATWFAEREELYRGAGAIGPRPAVSEDADSQTRLLAAFGRPAGT